MDFLVLFISSFTHRFEITPSVQKSPDGYFKWNLRVSSDSPTFSLPLRCTPTDFVSDENNRSAHVCEEEPEHAYLSGFFDTRSIS